jgi:carboxyl-terminal processing protease
MISHTRHGAAPAVEAAGELSMEDDLQLQKAVELLKTWKIFKELRPA